jgi:hypothetical protein
MAEGKHTGGPAFPTLPTYDGEGYAEQSADGMTLRDWFAGQALAGMMANGFRPNGTLDTLPGQFGGYLDTDTPFEKSAYRMADAMLAERSKP